MPWLLMPQWTLVTHPLTFSGRRGAPPQGRTNCAKVRRGDCARAQAIRSKYPTGMPAGVGADGRQILDLRDSDARPLTIAVPTAGTGRCHRQAGLGRTGAAGHEIGHLDLLLIHRPDPLPVPVGWHAPDHRRRPLSAATGRPSSAQAQVDQGIKSIKGYGGGGDRYVPTPKKSGRQTSVEGGTEIFASFERPMPNARPTWTEPPP